MRMNAHINRIVLVTRPEDFPHIVSQFFLVTVAHPCQHIAFEVRRAALERCPASLPPSRPGSHRTPPSPPSFSERP